MRGRHPPLEAQICIGLLVCCYPDDARFRLAQGRAPQELTLNNVVCTFEKHRRQRGRRPLADFLEPPEGFENG